MNTEEILENTEEVESSESVSNDEFVEDTETLEDDTESSETLEELLIRLLDDGASDQTESEAVESVPVATFETVVVDDTEILSNIHTDLTLIFMILLIWFASWLMRSWRVYMLKGGSS